MCSPNYQKIVRLALTRINILFFTVAVSATIAQPSLQLTFDSLGPTVEQLRLDSGRNIHFIDDGNQSGTPVVFTGGPRYTRARNQAFRFSRNHAQRSEP